jgi:hypothetical protein
MFRPRQNAERTRRPCPAAGPAARFCRVDSKSRPTARKRSGPRQAEFELEMALAHDAPAQHVELPVELRLGEALTETMCDGEP